METLDKITITDEAKEVMRQIEDEGLYTRLSMHRSGCCSIGFDVYPDACRGKDEITEIDGLHLIIEPRALPFIGSLKINYGKYGLGRKKLYVKMK